MDRAPYEAGFTLIELLVTVAIAALVAGVLFPAIEKMLGYWACRAAVASVEGGLGEARALALRGGRPVRFAIDSDSARFRVDAGAYVTLAPGAQLSATPGAVDFFPDGSASGGRVLIDAGAGERATLTVQPDTGLIGQTR